MYFIMVNARFSTTIIFNSVNVGCPKWCQLLYHKHQHIKHWSLVVGRLNVKFNKCKRSVLNWRSPQQSNVTLTGTKVNVKFTNIMILRLSCIWINCNKHICTIAVIIYKRANEMSVHDLCRANGSNWFLAGKANY